MMSVCGLDFGTSNSTVGFCSGSEVRMLPLEDEKMTLPSVVFFNADLDEIQYGRAALSAYLEGYEGRLMRSMKSLLGTALIDGHTEVQGRRLGYKQLLVQYITELRRRAEQSVQSDFQYAVFGRPVFFVDDQPDADRKAEQTLHEIALAAGFREVAFQFEPIAAALDYESRIVREELVLVVDIGGGTADFSLIRLSPERRQQMDRQTDILSNTGIHIGGTDFDKYLSLQQLMPKLGMGGRLNNGADMPSANYFNLATWHTINLLYSQKVVREIQDICRDIHDPELRSRCECLLHLIDQRDGHWLALKAEEAKIALSETEHVTLELERLREIHQLGKPILSMSRDQLDIAIAPLFAQLNVTITQAIKLAGVSPAQIDTVFFTGGASGVRGLRRDLASLLPNAKLVQGDVFGSIGAGLAWDAMRRFG
ncbi:Hsp70 family protein [Undibacterium fentianense]|uniref:Hsp70 family protein n=1 Tax=Undibacterium fentianense TaxID=2828728 RepID=A0A941IE55_9BURK|nr:Hsp70 family protein [Undibacterium fentianense]MBR7800718.1 Hsp70 family protein [Undibacterium fentianense]